MIDTLRRLVIDRVIQHAPALARSPLGDAVGFWVESLAFDDSVGAVDEAGWEAVAKVDGFVVAELAMEVVDMVGDAALTAGFIVLPLYFDVPEAPADGVSAYSATLKFDRRADADAGRGVLVAQYRFSLDGWLWAFKGVEAFTDVVLGMAPNIGPGHEDDYVPVAGLDADAVNGAPADV